MRRRLAKKISRLTLVRFVSGSLRTLRRWLTINSCRSRRSKSKTCAQKSSRRSKKNPRCMVSRLSSVTNYSSDKAVCNYLPREPRTMNFTRLSKKLMTHKTKSAASVRTSNPTRKSKASSTKRSHRGASSSLKFVQTQSTQWSSPTCRLWKAPEPA